MVLMTTELFGEKLLHSLISFRSQGGKGKCVMSVGAKFVTRKLMSKEKKRKAFKWTKKSLQLLVPLLVTYLEERVLFLKPYLLSSIWNIWTYCKCCSSGLAYCLIHNNVHYLLDDFCSNIIKARFMQILGREEFIQTAFTSGISQCCNWFQYGMFMVFLFNI